MSPREGSNHLIVELLLILARRKRQMIVFILTTGIVAAIVSYLLPNVYEANTRILTPQQAPSLASAFTGSSLAGLAGGARDLTSALKNPSDVYIAMLQSRTVADAIIDRFQLLSVYHSRRRMDCRKTLSGNVIIISDKGGIISITVHDKDAQRAADIANGFVEELHKMNQHLGIAEAGQRRLFYEQQLAQERDALTAAEAEMLQTQQSSKMIAPESQTKAVMEGISKLHEALAEKLAQLRMAELSATPNNANLMRIEAEIASFREQIAHYEKADPDGGFELSSSKLPEAGLEYMRRVRAVKYHESVMEILLRQYEAAKLDEAREGAAIQVLDPAIRPEFKIKPVRKLIVVVTCALSLILFLFWTLAYEALCLMYSNPSISGRMDLLARGWMGRYGDYLLSRLARSTES